MDRISIRWASAVALVLATDPVSAQTGQNAQMPNTFSAWGIAYTMPAGWRLAQAAGRLQVLVSTPDGGGIFIAPGMYSRPEEAIAALSSFYTSISMQGQPIEQPSATTVGSLRGITALYASRDAAGRTMHARFIALFTPHGTGINLLAMGPPEKIPALKTALDQLAASVTAQPPTVNQQLIAAFAGKWVYYDGKSSGGSIVSGSTSRSHEETVAFDGRGAFQWSSASTVSATASGDAANAMGSSTDGDRGSYTIIGNTIVFRGTKGQTAVDFLYDGQRIVAGGKTYIKQ